MFKTICLLFLICIHQSTQYSIKDQLSNIELKLQNHEISIDELLAELDENLESNEISQLNPNFNQYSSETNHKSSYALENKELDHDWNAKQMIEHRGFKYEAHHVVTEDCYILEMHRIVNPRDTRPNKIPVLLQHGLIDSSTGFLFNSLGGHLDDDDDRNLGFALAKRGYDVWLGNYRGNTYSRNHTIFSPKEGNFWKFTFDNHALQDLPAQIAHVQKETDYDQIAYLGYSQGSLSMFYLLALKPEVARILKPYIAMAPVAHLGNMPSPLRYLSSSRLLMRTLMYRNAEFAANSHFSRTFSAVACRVFPDLICKNFLYVTCGFSDRQLNDTRMAVYFSKLPAGTSLANLIHYGQAVQSKKVQMLDYMNANQNLECYNSITPPRIPLENIKNNDIYLLNAQNDLLADVKDVELLRESLRVKVEQKTVEIKHFGHMDFVLSKEGDRYVNRYVIEVLKNKIPEKRLEDGKRLRLKQFNKNTCNVPDTISKCHMDINRALNNVY